MKIRRKGLLAAFFLFALLFTGSNFLNTPARVEAARIKNQYVYKNGSWYYYNSKGKKQKGWYTGANGKKYYFGKTGAAQPGVVKIKGKKYYFDAKGKMLVSWQVINGRLYYFHSTKGYMVKNWFTAANGKRYYFGKKGYVQPGFQKVNGKLYYFDHKGKMIKNKFITENNQTYYLDKNGHPVRGKVKIKGAYYAFHKKTYVMLRNQFYKQKGHYYYYGSDGKLVKGLLKFGDYYRFFRKSDGRMLTGWQKVGKYTYYFTGNGYRIDNQKVTTKNGKMYYFSATGKLYMKNWATDSSGRKYYANKKGRLVTGWQTIDGNTYYFAADGVMQTGWVTIGTSQYYLEPTTGIKATDRWIDSSHYVNKEGVYVPGYASQGFIWPLPSTYTSISSYFGNRESPGGIGSTNHKGIDIPAPNGTPIYAVADGVVKAIMKPSQSGGGGNYTVITHVNGVESGYMHQSRFADGLAVGSTVHKGQIIGYVGNTGNSTGDHLHLEIKVNGVCQDPLKYVTKP